MYSHCLFIIQSTFMKVINFFVLDINTGKQNGAIVFTLT